MPVILRHKGYRFFFFSNEGDPLEPAHVHVRHGEAAAKIWLLPETSVAESYELTAAELRELVEVVETHRALILRRWNEYFPP
jgi:hypothetical protein